MDKRDKNEEVLISLVKKLKRSFAKERSILALYVYGSVLSKYFNPKKSDIDILMIVKDITNPAQFIKKVKRRAGNIKGVTLDLNIVFLSEFKMGWHIYRTPLFFIGVKRQSRLIFGKDLLYIFKEPDSTPIYVYKRVVDLAQGSRAIYVNNKKAEFWRGKYIKWLRVIVLEVLFLTGEFELHFPTGLKKLQKKYHGLGFLSCLKKDILSMAVINSVAEQLVVFMREKILL